MWMKNETINATTLSKNSKISENISKSEDNKDIKDIEKKYFT